MSTGRDRRDDSLFSDAERSRFKQAEEAPSVYKPAAQEGDPASQAVRHERKFRVALRGRDTVSPYEQEQAARFAMDPRSRRVVMLACTLVVVLVAVIVLPNYLFDVNNHNLSPAWFIEVLSRNVSNFTRFVSGGGAYGSIDFVVFRFLIVGLAGAALAMSGAAYQGSLKNQMASPSTLGVMSGAQLGTVAYVLAAPYVALFSYNASGDTLEEVSSSLFGGMNPLEYVFAVSQRGLCSLAGSALVVCVVLLISRFAGHGKTSRVAMVITGQVIAAFVGSAIVVVRMYIQMYGTPEQLDALSYIMVGGFAETFTLTHLLIVGVPIVICMCIIIAMRAKLNLLAFGEEEARAMGVRVGAVRCALVACCTVLTAVVVAFCGPVGFVGFLIPHLTRRIIGPDFRYLVVASGLVGAIFMLVVYYLFTCFTIPSGSITMMTTAVGVVLFVVMLFQQRRLGYDSW